jgi:hypothetical protein
VPSVFAGTRCIVSSIFAGGRPTVPSKSGVLSSSLLLRCLSVTLLQL